MPPRKAECRITLGYVRCSTDEQVLNGVTIDAQAERLTQYARATGRELARIIVDDGQSGKSLKRPGIADILAAIRRNEVAAVLTCKLDRLTRNVGNLAELLDLFARHEVALISVAENLDSASASGRLMCNVLGSVAQWEREAIAERTAIALAFKRRNRRVYGRTPFGFIRDGKALVPNREEHDALMQAVQMRRDGASWRAIGLWLQEHGFSPRQGGKQWYPGTVRALLTSRMTTDLVAGAVCLERGVSHG